MEISFRTVSRCLGENLLFPITRSRCSFSSSVDRSQSTSSPYHYSIAVTSNSHRQSAKLIIQAHVMGIIELTYNHGEGKRGREEIGFCDNREKKGKVSGNAIFCVL